MNSNYISTESLYDSGAHLIHAKQYSHKYIKREPDGRGGYRYYYRADSGPVAAYSREFNNAYDYRDYGRYVTLLNDNGKKIVTGRATTKQDARKVIKNLRESDKAAQIYGEGLQQTHKDYANKLLSNRTPRKSRETHITNSKDTAVDIKKRGEGLGTGPVGKKDENNKPQSLPSEVSLSSYEIFKKNVEKTISNVMETAKDTVKKGADFIKATSTAALSSISNAAGSAYDKGKKFIQGLFK